MLGLNLRSMSAILDARKRAGLTAAEVGSAIGRTSTWISQREIGIIRLQPDVEQVILTAIARLAKFAQTVAAAKAKLCADLKLPPASTGPGTHRPQLPGD